MSDHKHDEDEKDTEDEKQAKAEAAAEAKAKKAQSDEDAKAELAEVRINNEHVVKPTEGAQIMDPQTGLAVGAIRPGDAVPDGDDDSE